MAIAPTRVHAARARARRSLVVGITPDAYTEGLCRATRRAFGLGFLYAVGVLTKRAELDEPSLIAKAQALGTTLQCGDLVLLEGSMGAGKTTFTRALARGLGITRPERVRSPTYNICLVHQGVRPLVHIDLFRLGADEGTDPTGSVSGAAFEALGLEAWFDGAEASEAVVVVEWADLWATPPASFIRIRLDASRGRDGHRILTACAVGPTAHRRLESWIVE